MKTCGECKFWVKWSHMYCGANAPAWANNRYMHSFRFCLSENEQANDCDCFVPRNPAATKKEKTDEDR